MKAAIRKARELDEVEQIHLTVVRTNHAAKNLYSSLGFKIIVQEEKALKYKGEVAWWRENASISIIILRDRLLEQRTYKYGTN